MNMDPEDYARSFKIDLDMFDLLSERSRHGDEGGIGASNFGCREEMRRILTRSERTDAPDKLAAIIGGYIDAGVKRARKAANPNLILDADLTVTMPNGFSFPVHPDEIDPDEPSVTDVKTKDGLEAIRRGFADEQYRFQRHIQYYAAVQAGLVGERGVVRNVFIDRSGKDPRPHVEQEEFSLQVIREATDWLDDVLYAVKHREEASKDRPRIWCKDYCPFYTACRGNEIDVEDITDPRVAAMVDELGAAKSRLDVDSQLRGELLDAGLRGLTGRTGRYQITSKWVNSVKQTPHWRVEIEPVPHAQEGAA